MDAVYIWGPPSARTAEDLRWSLRFTANRFLAVDGTIWIASGIMPPSVFQRGRVKWLRGSGSPNRVKSSRGNLRAAIDDPRVSDPFVLMHDDQFVLAPIDTVPVGHLGALGRRASDLHSVLPASRWTRRHVDTRRVLGYSFCYDHHYPLLVHKDAMRAALDMVDESPVPILYRSTYGHLARLGGEFVSDCKIRTSLEPLPDLWACSTSDSSWSGEAGAVLRSMEQEKMPWEKPISTSQRHSPGTGRLSGPWPWPGHR
jgi:hypothetical protein